MLYCQSKFILVPWCQVIQGPFTLYKKKNAIIRTIGVFEQESKLFYLFEFTTNMKMWYYESMKDEIFYIIMIYWGLIQEEGRKLHLLLDIY